MSHFAVLVIGENVEKQLAPYHEYECTGKDDEYVIDVDCSKEVEDWLKRILFVGKNKEDKLDYQYYEEKAKEEFGNNYRKLSQKEFLQEKGESIDNEIKEDFGYEKKEGKWINHTNPNAYWDWYQVGGRWAGSLKLKKDVDKSKYNNPNFSWGWDKESQKEVLEKGFVDSARKGDIDFSLDEEEMKGHRRFWELVVDEEPLKKGEEKPFCFYKKEYFTEKYGDKETYAKLKATFSTYAVVKDGVWYAQGDMGWWGCSSETPKESRNWEENFVEHLNKLSGDTMLTIVDCHI